MKFHRLLLTALATLVLSYFPTRITAQSSSATDTQIEFRRTLEENSAASDQLESYQLIESDFFQSAKKIKTNENLQLDLGSHSMKLKVYNDNVTVASSLAGRVQLLGGTTETGGQVSLTMAENFIYGFVEIQGTRFYIQPLYYFDKKAKANQFIFFNENDVKDNHKGHVCGKSLKGDIPENLLTKSGNTGCKIINMAIANSNDMLVKYGSANAVLNHNLAVLNNVQTDFRSEFGTNVEFNMAAFYVASNTNEEPFDTNSSSTDANQLLPAFKNWASDGNGGLPGGTQGGFSTAFDLAAVWTARDITQGTNPIVGLAFTPGWFQILEDHTSSASRLQTLMTHETGHNFSAGHDAAGSTTIMAPSTSITFEWSPGSVNTISNYIGQLNYLPSCSSQGAPVAVAFQSSFIVCEGASVTYEDQSRYGNCSNWTFENGDIANSTDPKPTVTYSQQGYHLVELTSSNNSGSDNFTSYINVQQEPAVSCTPNSGTGTGGISGFIFSNLNHLSGLSNTNGNYENNICEGTASLIPGMTHELRITLEGITYVNFYFDFNADGDFSDAGEMDTGYFINSDGTYLVPMTMPASPSLNTLIRMRVVTSNSPIGSACDTPLDGQTEDYGIFFFSAQVTGCTDPSANNYNPQATIDDGTCDYGTTSTWYRDQDGDGYGNPNDTQSANAMPTGYVMDNTDCNDNNPNVNPTATEICDGLDNNCNGTTDENLNQNTYYLDSDNDGYGNSAITITDCTLPSGYAVNGEDCDDTDPQIHPSIQEVCDGVDNNCDGNIDDVSTNNFYLDQDGDGYGDSNNSIMDCNQPTGYAATGGDCDDSDPAINPGAPELCDGVDNNCNGTSDEGLQAISYYQDNDNDSFGDFNISMTSCIPVAGYVTVPGDCDDNDPEINPAAPEVCDGLDNNCNGSNDEGFDFVPYYRDIDGDGYGVTSISITACAAPDGYSAEAGDCNDNDPLIYPGATEQCDGTDNNCNGSVDDGTQTMTFYQDQDNDGYGDDTNTVIDCMSPEGYVTIGGDCNDQDESIHPTAMEQCDGVDNNCSGDIDEGVQMMTFYQDQDNDGYGDDNTSVIDCISPEGYVTVGGDCNDQDDLIHPTAMEQCDGVDNNCSGSIDEGVQMMTFYQDQDNDGYGDDNTSVVDCISPEGHVAVGGDCNDLDESIHPTAMEQCDGVDNNCNGAIDEGVQMITYYQDQDNDGYGDDNTTVSDCRLPEGYVTVGGDCNDQDDLVHPIAIEQCDGIDNNCSGDIDEGVQMMTFYQDQDNDGYGDDNTTVIDCTSPQGYVAVGGDCNDQDNLVHPTAMEQCDGVDNNCNGNIDDGVQAMTFFQDLDNDGYGDDNSTLSDCLQPQGYVATGGDCNDLDPNIHPDATDVCDGVDNNCSGTADDAGCNSIRSFVWEDNNLNYVFDTNEKGLAGVIVKLFRTGKSTFISETTTGTDGSYSFEGLSADDYEIQIDISGFADYIVNYNSFDYSQDGNLIQSIPFYVGTEETTPLPISFYKGGTISGSFYFEQTQDPVQSQVFLYQKSDSNNPVASTMTNAQGEYEFKPIAMGSYFLEFVSPVAEQFLTNASSSSNSNINFTYLDDTGSTLIGQTEAYLIMPADILTNINAVLAVSSNTLGIENNLELTATWDETINATILNWNFNRLNSIDEIIIERSLSAGSSFSEIDKIDYDNTSEFVYHDKLTDDGIYYYRVISISENGTRTTSNIASVNVDLSKNSLRIYPNPTNNIVTVEMRDGCGEPNLSIIDKSGRVVLKPDAVLNQDNITKVDLSGLSDGVYYLRIECAGHIQNARITKVN